MPTTAGHTESPRASEVRGRDAAKTRGLLLQAARVRFARDGYSVTTVRDIAADAGVNVALINRYFTSKEGLFEASLRRVVEDLDQQTGSGSIAEVIEAMIDQVSGTPTGEQPLHLMLLLRSSGDRAADQIRQGVLASFAEGIATAAGWTRDDPRTDPLLLRAQIALSMGLGIVLMRTATELPPLTSASAEVLRGPMTEALTTLLSPPGEARP